MVGSLNPADHMAASAKQAIHGAMAAARAQVQRHPTETALPARAAEVDPAPTPTEASPARPGAL